MSNARRVYSTGQGDLRRGERQRAQPPAPGDGIVRVARETKGRRGKGVTLVHGLPRADLERVAADLKKLCGAGGAVKDGVVEVQGEHRDKIVARLEAAGYRVKRAGG